MQLLADRFVSEGANSALDLATGERVALTIACAGGDGEQRSWASRCAALQKLHHPTLARLIDYGRLGESQRFEAWRWSATWDRPASHAESICARASSVLLAAGLSAGSASASSVRHSPFGAIVLPDDGAGYPCGQLEPAHLALPIEERGILALERRAVAAIGELFERAEGPRPRIAAMWGPEGAGKSTAVVELARRARLHGFVPLLARLVPTFANQLAGRSLFVISDAERGLGWTGLLRAALAAGRPHILMFVGREEVPSVDGIGLDPLAVEQLVDAVCPALEDAAAASRVRHIAERAGGWPGRFARLLWREAFPGFSEPIRRACRRTSGSRAAEQTAVYGVDHSVPVVQSVSASQPVEKPDWPAPTELAALRRQIQSAVQLIDAGRHASGERVLRQAIGGLSRREDWSHAGEGSVALARLLIRRGRAHDARVALEWAADYWSRGADQTRLLDVAALNGVALIELVRLEEAETVLSAAAAAARAAGDLKRASHATSELARVLFWQGHYDEADQALTRSMCEWNEGSVPRLVVSGLQAAIAVGRRAFDLGVSRAVAALQQAEKVGDPREVTDAAYGAAFAHLAVGDLAAVERDVAACVAAARTLHEPLRAARGRLILAEALRRSNRRAEAALLLKRISSLRTILPPIIRARCDLLQEVLSSTAPAWEIAARHAAATGLNALALFVPGEATGRVSAFELIVDDIVSILDICQASDDEHAILIEVCRRVRARIHAVAVGFVVIEGASCSPMASDGGRVETVVAQRAVAAGTTLAPHRCDDRTEAASLVRYGGQTIGVLVARWTIGTRHDLGMVPSLLATAAAGAAPILYALLLRRRQASSAETVGLLGTSAAMTEVRQAVQRAAAAPFSVLIEGESGSGKELVARALHRLGPRRDRPMCTLNCAALPDDLVEAELFGHSRGAFTGAVAERPGVFEEAHGGTLFLDEIGELSPRAQAKLLRVLQDGELRRVGENTPRRIDVRAVSATNRHLGEQVAAGRFRLDLLYRLDVIRIGVPPLRERREDIVLLAEHYWREAAGRVGSRATLAAATIAALTRYDWPGNVRELQNVLAALVVRSPRRGIVPPTALGPQFSEPRFSEDLRLDAARRTFEERFVRAALARTGGHRGRAALELGVSRQGLTKLIGRLGIVEERAGGSSR